MTPAVSTGAWLPVYAQMPLVAVSGHGSWIVDEDGNEWLDAYGGHAVASTGHCHPHVVKAIQDQAAKLIFYSTAVPIGFVRNSPNGSPRGARVIWARSSSATRAPKRTRTHWVLPAR